MRRIAFVLSVLAYAGHARQAQAAVERPHSKSNEERTQRVGEEAKGNHGVSHSATSFAALLDALSPASLLAAPRRLPKPTMLAAPRRPPKAKEEKPKIPIAENAAVFHARLMAGGIYRPRFEALPLAFLQREPDEKLTVSLALHAEKKALSDLLRREMVHWGEKGKQSWKKLDLRMDVNFHVCVDCHDYFKAASLLLAREIHVREPKMTHHFDKGWCTCNDLWRWEERARKRRVEEGSEDPRGFNVR
mmetsp:Transcript_127829/g.238992  ORF Transcript_127829/g.238992 Transcript_127829/m.238992 type:complete len:247 (+) Transcript_127829:48-788(+)